jgi:hypothetical protein
MAYVTPGTVAAGDVATAAAWNVVVNDVIDLDTSRVANEAAWTAWTPTFTGTWANGNATTTGKYQKIGKRVFFYGSITIGTTTTKSGTMEITLPATALVSTFFAPHSTVKLQQNGVGLFHGSMRITSTVKMELNSIAANGSYLGPEASVSPGIPFTWAATDVVYVAGVYEAA